MPVSEEQHHGAERADVPEELCPRHSPVQIPDVSVRWGMWPELCFTRYEEDSRCPWPVTINNAETRLIQESRTFGDYMEVICNSGFMTADGQRVATSRCQGDRKWSFTAPCEDITTSPSVCEPPPEIENGFHADGPYQIDGEVHYWCDYGYRLEGASTLLCQENREWSHKAPTCQPVYCSRPADIANGAVVNVNKSQHPVGTVIFYLCNKEFYLDGSYRGICLENGNWSQPPACRARCPIHAQRSRVVYKGRKLWIDEIPGKEVHHGESVTFFCRSQNKTCSLQAESQCFDGLLKLPSCYNEPTYLQYHLFPRRVVSEIPEC
ncbi:beta-2-glycoprotein 1-like isoform X3 [Sphaerodactylus townsendi]|uniref:beta-2-glycoprotein 1-like isoform X3 n=1 Tax=Sphaerodactylus townsendi TaxID=933632 RepID=UPI002026D773|nr:beta-2-glycoprotein 1-like isoform X3 [Sphaerodactylus townsendi]